MSKKSFIKFAIIIFFLCSTELFSQMADPITPQAERQPEDIGVIFGLGANLQSGVSKVDCENCEFENGSKFGFSIGALYENGILKEKLKWGIIGLYDNLSIYSSFKEREAFEYEPSKFVPINFRHHSDLSVSVFSAIPFIKWSPTEILFFRAGPNISYISTAHVTHEKEILDKTADLPNGETVSVHFSGSNSTKITVEDGDYRDVRNLQFGLSLMGGLNFQIDSNYTFAPYFFYNLPFSNISDYGKNLKISSWRIVFEFRIKI